MPTWGGSGIAAAAQLKSSTVLGNEHGIFHRSLADTSLLTNEATVILFQALTFSYIFHLNGETFLTLNQG